MSVYLKISQFAGQPRLFRLRKLSALLGENAAGVFTENLCSRPFFSLHANGMNYYVEGQHPDLRYNRQPLAVGGLQPLQTGDLLQIGDYCMTVVVTSSWAETLAGQTDLDLTAETAHDFSLAHAWRAEVNLASLSRYWHLLPGCSYTVGSDSTAAIHLDPQIYGDFQMRLKVTATSLTVAPECGVIQLKKDPLINSVTLATRTELEITPTRLPFLLEPVSV